MIIIEDLGGIQDIELGRLTKIVGGASEETSESIFYEPIDFPTCPLYLFPEGIVGHLCPNEPKPKLPNDPIPLRRF